MPITNQLTDQEKRDWADLFKKADEGDKVAKKDVEDITCVKEMMQLKYVPAVWADGDEPNEEDSEEEEDKGNEKKKAKKKPQPKFDAHFMGVTYSPASGHTTNVGPLSPEWVRHFFKGVYVNLIMLRPHHMWPMIVGNTRSEDDAHAPNALLIPDIPVCFQQFEREQCLVMGVASSLHYCGLVEEAKAMSLLAGKYEHLPKTTALKELKKDMQQFVPCIGDCELFNAWPAKRKILKKLSIQELLEKRTRFPTVVIPYGRDGSNNHSFVVVDDLIFDATQVFALKLCQKSLDWICGKDGIGSIDVAMRFNRSHGTRNMLSHKERSNW